MVAKRGHTIGQTFIPLCEKHKSGRIPTDPAIVAAIGHRFMAKKRRKLKMMSGSEATRARPETGHFFCLRLRISLGGITCGSFVGQEFHSCRDKATSITISMGTFLRAIKTRVRKVGSLWNSRPGRLYLITNKCKNLCIFKYADKAAVIHIIY